MANPNVFVATSMQGKTAYSNVTTAFANVVQNASTEFFTGTVVDYGTASPQTVRIQITQNSIPSGSKKYQISVSARSNGAKPPMNDNGCSAIRNKAYK